MPEPKPLRVLIVEDEYFIADDLARALGGHGMAVLGPVASVDEARTLAERETPDCAVLDLNLGGELAHDLARWLHDRGTRVLIVTGYDAATLPASLEGIPRVQKPLTAAALVALLEEAGGA